VVWEDYPLEKDYTWEPIENLYGHEDLAQTYEQWLKTENERLDSVEAERKTARKMTAQKVQDVAADQFRKNDKFTKKAKGTDNTSRQTLHQEVEQDEAEAAADEDVNNGCDDGGQVSYHWCCPHRAQYVHFVYASYHGHYLGIPSQHLRRAARALRACCPSCNLAGSPGEVDRAD